MKISLPAKDAKEAKGGNNRPFRISPTWRLWRAKLLLLCSFSILIFPCSGALLTNINVGDSANDGRGDTLRDAFIKVNGNNLMIEAEFARKSNATFFGTTTISNLVGTLTLTNTTLIGTTSITNLVQFARTNTAFVRLDGNNATAAVGFEDKAYGSISNALVAVPNNHQVLIGPGNYNNHKGMVAHQTGGRATFMLVNLTNVHIRGAGSGTKIQFTNAGTCFFVSNCYNVRISDLALYGLPPLATGFDAGLTNVHAAIEVEGSDKCVFENLHIENHWDQGIYSYQKGGAARSSNCVVRNCTFINLGSWVIDSFNPGAAGRYDGAAVVPGSGWTVQDCEMYSCARGIEPFAEYGRHDPCRLIGNKIFNSMDEAIAFGGNALSAGASYGWWTGGEISGNYILYAPGFSRLGSNAVASAKAITVHSASNVVVRANYVEGAPQSGIYVSGGFGSNVVNALVEGNYVKGTKGEHGILLYPINFSSVMNSTVRGNYVSDTFITAIKVSGSNNVVSGNIVDRWNLRNNDAQPAIYVFNPDNPTESVTDTDNIIVKDNIVWDDVVFAGDSGIKLDAGVKKIRAPWNIIQPTNITAILNNAGAELIYDEYATTLGGTNLLVGGYSMMHRQPDFSNLMPFSLVNLQTISANYLTSANKVFAGNLSLGPYYANPSNAAINHTNQDNATYNILLKPDGGILLHSDGPDDFLFLKQNIAMMCLHTNGVAIGKPVTQPAYMLDVTGHVGLRSNVTLNSRSAGQLLRTDAATNIAAVTIGANITFDGTTLSATGGGSATNAVSNLNGLATNLTAYGTTIITNEAYLRAGDAAAGPSLDAETIGIFNNTATSGKNALVSLISGAVGHAQITFGDTASQTNGLLFYDNFDDSFSTHVNGDLAMMINNARQVGFGTATPTARLHVVNNTATNVPLLAVGAAGQSTNLFEVKNSAGAILYYIDSAGEVIQSGSSVAGRTKYFGTNGNYVEIGAHKDNGSNSVFLFPTNGMAGNSAGVIVYTNTSGIENQGTIVPLGKYTVNSVTNFVISNGTNTDITSITLTPGDWDVSGMVDFIRSGADFTSASFYMSVSPTVGNDFAGQVNGYNASQVNGATTNFTSWTLTVPAVRVNTGTNITVNLKAHFSTFVSGTPVVTGRISARQWR